jgi:hypothetical protein
MYAWLGKQTVCIFFSNGAWTPAQVTAAGADAAGEPVQGASNLWIPLAGFNEAWNSTPSVQTDMGYAVSAQARTMQGRVQPFANGAMLYSDSGFVYVIYNNGKWELYPDTSSHGDLITPTPEPSPSSSPSLSPSAAPKNDTGSSPAPSDAGSPPASPAGAASAGGNVSVPGS